MSGVRKLSSSIRVLHYHWEGWDSSCCHCSFLHLLLFANVFQNVLFSCSIVDLEETSLTSTVCFAVIFSVCSQCSWITPAVCSPVNGLHYMPQGNLTVSAVTSNGCQLSNRTLLTSNPCCKDITHGIAQTKVEF